MVKVLGLFKQKWQRSHTLLTKIHSLLCNLLRYRVGQSCNLSERKGGSSAPQDMKQGSSRRENATARQIDCLFRRYRGKYERTGMCRTDRTFQFQVSLFRTKEHHLSDQPLLQIESSHFSKSSAGRDARIAPLIIDNTSEFRSKAAAIALDPNLRAEKKFLHLPSLSFRLKQSLLNS